MLIRRTNQNSILFLTTLGVCLGIIVVGGASPQVFAHSATTRHFELKDEVELSDDLDNKPDDERSPLQMSLQNYLQDVEVFFERLKRLRANGKFDLDSDVFEVSQSTQLPCVAANRVGSYTANKFSLKNEALRPTLESLSKLLTDGYSLSDCLPNSRFPKTDVTDSNFNFKLDRDNFTVEVTVKKASPQDANLLAAGLLNTGKRLKISSENAVLLRLYEKTTFRAENDQVFVVTRLPRADLESLLAKGE